MHIRKAVSLCACAARDTRGHTRSRSRTVSLSHTSKNCMDMAQRSRQGTPAANAAAHTRARALNSRTYRLHAP